MNAAELPDSIDAAITKLGERQPTLRSQLRAYRAAIIGDEVAEADAQYAAPAARAATFIAASVPPGADPTDVIRWHTGSEGKSELAWLIGQLRNVGTLPD